MPHELSPLRRAFLLGVHYGQRQAHAQTRALCEEMLALANDLSEIATELHAVERGIGQDVLVAREPCTLLN